MDRLERILKERKLKGVRWGELASKLPVTGEGLRIAFARGSVQDEYLEVVEQMLGIVNKPTEPTKEKAPPEEARFEDIVAEKVYQRIGPLLNGNTEKLLKAIINLQMQLDLITASQEETQEKMEDAQETLQTIEKKLP